MKSKSIDTEISEVRTVTTKAQCQKLKSDAKCPSRIVKKSTQGPEMENNFKTPVGA